MGRNGGFWAQSGHLPMTAVGPKLSYIAPE
jgi:hypothetical protein